jgi:hypothetical protein
LYQCWVGIIFYRDQLQVLYIWNLEHLLPVAISTNHIGARIKTIYIPRFHSNM